MNSKFRPERSVPWEVKWTEIMTKVEDLFNQTDVQPVLVKEQVEIKRHS